MKSFEEFIESRQKMDPSARKMTERQWEQAYAAYRSSRERSRSGTGDSPASGASTSKTRRRRSEVSGVRGMHGPSTVSDLEILKLRIRKQSAYADLRLTIDVLAWVAIAVVIVIALLSMSAGFNVYTMLTALVGGGLNVLVVCVVKFLVQVIIDIPDIALYQTLAGRESNRSPSESPESAN